MATTTTVWLTTAVTGFHAWPDAPDAVAYLRAQHRHRFGVRVEVLVDHDHRDVEFHMLKREVHEHLPLEFERDAETGEYAFGALSCEHIATALFLALNNGGYRVASVTVDEDGECGATVRRA